MNISRSKQIGYIYLKNGDGKYQIFSIINDNYTTQYLLYAKNHQELIDILKNEYNAILKKIHEDSLLYTVWLNTEKDAIATIDYLTSFLIIDKLGENL